MISDCHVIRVDVNDIGNGPGIRVTVWTAGCSHECPGCHNPSTWKWKQGHKLTESLVSKILDACDRPYIRGLSLSGGDPLFPKSREGVEALLKAFRERFGSSKDVWLWTGYDYAQVKDLSLLDCVDVLVDGKFVQELKDPRLKYAGSSNQKVIHLKEVRHGESI